MQWQNPSSRSIPYSAIYEVQAGDVYEVMPGITQLLLQEIDIHPQLNLEEDDEFSEDMEWRPQCVIVGLNILESFLSSAKPSNLSNPFVERFKYNVISSSLLSTSLSGGSYTSSRSPMGSIPGRLGGHSRSTSIESIKSDAVFAYSSNSRHGLASFAALATAIFWAAGNRFWATLSLGSLSFIAYQIAVSPDPPTHDFTPTFNSLDELVAANATWESTVQDAIQLLEKEEAITLRNLSTTTPAMTSNTLRVSLHTTLQTTRTQCDNVRQLFSALTCPSELSQLSEMYAPPSPLKSPLSLVDSPNTRPYSFPTRHRGSSVSSPTTPQNKRSTWHAANLNATSYSSLASVVGSPTTGGGRKVKRRSNVSTLFQESSGAAAVQQGTVGSPEQRHSASAPVSPFPLSPLPPTYSLSQIAEDIHHQDTSAGAADEFGSVFQAASPSVPVPVPMSPFGPAALGLQRKRKADGFEALSPPPNRFYSSFMAEQHRSPRWSQPPVSPQPHRMSTTFAPSSRFTTATSAAQPSSASSLRHPLSLFTLNQSLQGAVSAKRYACAHLLALRFSEDEEEYWENVRSMMELLTSTFCDEAARLGEALEDVERQKLRDQNPTPAPEEDGSVFGRMMMMGMEREGDEEEEEGEGEGEERDRRRSQHPLVSSLLGSVTTTEEVFSGRRTKSFAPMPSHLSRFAAHVAAITSALEDARDHLQECVDSLKEGSSASTPSSQQNQQNANLALRRRQMMRHKKSLSRMSSSLGLNSREGSFPDEGLGLEEEEEEHRAIQAYDRLRRELGMALRECERGKQKLVDIVNPPVLSSDDDDDASDSGTPGFAHDLASDESDSKLDPISPSEDEEDKGTAVAGAEEVVVHPHEAAVDDVTRHLLMETSIQHLPPVGVEQVYEADTSGAVPFSRERSKLTREERIKMMKAKREAAAAAAGSGSLSGSGDGFAGLFQPEPVRKGKMDKWGPGGEVVAELKDVIWKVGEKRRKMQESQELQMQMQMQQQQQRRSEMRQQQPGSEATTPLSPVHESESSSSRSSSPSPSSPLGSIPVLISS
ncbi:hypothetical protein MD484_g4486, partial [Candolleomyces efflorescens]